MRILPKIAAVAFLIASPCALSDIELISDEDLGAITGQRGISIELETQVSIDQFIYTDEGSLVASEIRFGGAGVTQSGQTQGYGVLLDEVRFDFDVEDTGNLVISMDQLNDKPIDWGLHIGSVETKGTRSTSLLSNLDIYGLTDELEITVDTATDRLQLSSSSQFEIDFDVPFLGIAIEGTTITGPGSNIDLDGDGVTCAESVYECGIDEGYAWPQSQEELLKLWDQAKESLQYVKVSASIYKGDGLGSSTKRNVLRADFDPVYMDMDVDNIYIGGKSIGSLQFDNISLTDTKLAIYGH
ncbi:DUF6160 family protein [Marinobacter sp. F4218]|uniref:DUF6160 family protein n=1 Tax=Marinobacter sp. F4218 TaxID=2862868 RepID=UPI001C635A77|nr:DUF6160 family protein [Marinobacter sp. F4218]MBW7472312.1 hypothetical protein [Marinobacter sp. F4218]